MENNIMNFMIDVLTDRLDDFEGNLIYPKVVGRSVGLPGIWVLVAVTIGASTFGIVGMIISVPLCAILYGVLVNVTNERLKKQG